MALTHHFIVRVAACRVGITRFRDYALLGDDIVIRCDRVAASYRELCSLLDMPISETKTHVSENTYEFAKRWIHAGEEITPFSLAGIFETWKRYPLLSNFLDTQQQHGWIPPEEGAPGILSLLYDCFHKHSQKERVLKLYRIYHSLKRAKEMKDYSCVAKTIQDVFPDFPEPKTDPDGFVRNLLTEFKTQTMMKEMETIQTDAFKINDYLNNQYLKIFPGSDTQSYRAALRKYTPLITVLNKQVEGLMMDIMTLTSGPDDEDYHDLIWSGNISRYWISKGVFSLRQHHSISLAQSQLTKGVINM